MNIKKFLYAAALACCISGTLRAQSVLNDYTFVNDFKGETINDANQTTANPLLGTQSDGKFEISFPDGISSYKAVYNTGFAHSIDMSETADQKLRVRFTYTGTPGTFRFYLSDADGTNRFIDVMPTEGLNEKELSYNSGWTEGGTVSGFDLSQVVRFNVSTGGSAVSAGKLAFEWLHIGAEYIPLTLGFETFTSTRGLTLTASPAAPMIGENAFLFKDPVTNEPATGVTATLLDGGAKFNFRGLDINKSYRIAIEDALFYLNKSYTVSGGGMTEGAPIVEVRPSVIFTSVDMVIVDFNKAAVGLGKDNFVLKNAATGDIIPIDYVTSGFVGKEYQLFTALEAGKNYTLEIAAENYLFGDPLEVATGLRPNPVGPGVIWEQVLGKITADHWGLNHIMSGGYSNGHYEDVHPGIVRIMGAGFTGSDWVNTEKEHWDTLRVKTFMDANKDRFDVIHNGGGKILLSIYKPPMTQTLPIADLTTEDKEVALLGQLPGVIRSLGYYIDMYEVFNESDGVYWGSGKPNNLAEYVRVLSKTARAMKATDPTVKVGGPATAWSYAEVYKAFGDNCLDDMDFFSFHMYSGGTAEMTDMSALFPGYTSRVSSAASVVNYFKEKGKTNYDVYLNEWLTGSWSPYEPCQDNHIGAAWMAVTIKNLALAGVTGTNVWYYRINENMAGSQLYKLSRDHLRGDIVYSKTNSSVEILPVLSAEGKKNVLIINKTKSSITITNAKSLIGGDASKMVAMRLDESTVLNPELANTSGVRYGVDVMPKVPQDILLLPYGMILLSDDGGQNLGIETSLPTESNAFRVFPNPFAETVYISGEGGVLNIYNVMGVKVGSRTVERNQTVSLGNLPRGQYIFQLINNGKVQTVKAVKK